MKDKKTKKKTRLNSPFLTEERPSNNDSHNHSSQEHSAYVGPPLIQHGGGALHEPLMPGIPTRGQMICDPANICTLMGVMLSSFAMAAVWKGNYDVGLTLNLAANVADIIDGPIARNTPRRPHKYSVLGAKLDTYSDLISHFVVPASILMNMSSMDVMYMGLGTIWVVTGIIRQSYFEVLQRCGDGVFGVASDYMPPLFSLSAHLLPICGLANTRNFVLPVLAACTLFMIYGSLTFSLKTRHYSRLGLFTTTLFNISLCISLLLMTIRGSFTFESAQGWWSWEGLSLMGHLVLAYPCYFKFIELNM